MMILNLNNPLVTMVYTKIVSALRVKSMLPVACYVSQCIVYVYMFCHRFEEERQPVYLSE